MARLRRVLLAVAVVASLAGVSATRAHAAAPPCPSPQANHLSSAHFDLTFNGDPSASDYITATQAGDVLAAAEQAYSAFAGMGFPTPAVNGSGKTGISVINLSTFKLSGLNCLGDIDFDSLDVDKPDMAFNLGFDVFAEIELGFGATDPWLTQGAAAWASWKALGFPSDSVADIGPFEMSLDCWDASLGSACASSGYENLGLSRWPFYEFLAERFGTTFLLEVLADAQGGTALSGLQAALAAHGTTLAAEYAAYSTKLMTGGWTALSLNVARPPVSGAPIRTGAATGPIPSQTFGVNHLATRYVEIDRGDGSGAHQCFPATLKLTVQIPAGVVSQPTFYWNQGGVAPVALSVSGNTATTTVPWDTCLWQAKGYLSLPNSSTTINGANFVVSGQLTVDTTTPATASPPPAPASPYGQIVDATNSGVAPTITVFGPEVVALSADDSQIRLIVESSGEGTVAAALGPVLLGVGALRPGENDLRFALPKNLLRSLRLSASAAPTILTLTPRAADGVTIGWPVTQRVSIVPAPPVAKPKAKPKPKRR